MKILYQSGVGEVVEKKSRFIANVFPIHSEEAVTEYLEQIRKKHYDARHHCYAYVLGEKNETMRSSDDGEPQGTAGHPILDVLVGEDVHDALIVVTRYFGGTLLGTGGLVRAYSAAAKQGLQAAQIVEKEKGIRLLVHTDYNGMGKIQYIMANHGVTAEDIQYGEAVEMTLLIPMDEREGVIRDITEGTAGKAAMEQKEEIFIGNLDGKVCEM